MINIEKAESARVTEHLRFLQEFLRNVTTNLQARLQLGKKSEDEQISMTNDHQREIDALRQKCNDVVGENLRKRIVLHITTTAETLYGYMSTRIGKEKILNPDGYRAIVDVCDSPEECANEVRRRFGLYIESYLKSDKVVHGFTLIQKDMEIFYKETNLKLNSMQNELSGVLKDDNVTTLSVPFMFNLPLEAFAKTFGLHVLSDLLLFLLFGNGFWVKIKRKEML
uniref:Uncharacterized protein LOC111100297 n=1 Tax=Crassostrea virginica TaxID=6565 RepID=A0A8B8ACS4_CRAVI|nr:uncharacterized protein LOC111100297 [Crassostrea virginica]